MQCPQNSPGNSEQKVSGVLTGFLVNRNKGKIEQIAPDSDEHFAFIAGYTAGSLPYGVTWEELEKIEGCDAALSTGPGGKT